MKKYIRKFQEADSLSDLTDVKLVDELVKYIQDNPFPKDQEGLHKWAEDRGYEPDKIEQYIYAIISVILCGGKSKGDISKITKDQLDIGFEIEYEHVNLDKKYEDNKVIEAIQDFYRKKISSDHFSENNKYYTTSTDFKAEMEKEGK